MLYSRFTRVRVSWGWHGVRKRVLISTGHRSRRPGEFHKKCYYQKTVYMHVCLCPCIIWALWFFLHATYHVSLFRSVKTKQGRKTLACTINITLKTDTKLLHNIHNMSEVERFLGALGEHRVRRLSIGRTTQRFAKSVRQLLSWRFLEDKYITHILCAQIWHWTSHRPSLSWFVKTSQDKPLLKM